MKGMYTFLHLTLLLATVPVVILHSQTPCIGAPGSNVVLASQTIVCPGSTVSLSLLNSYTVTGLTFQWQSSTISPVGPYTNLPGATLNTYTTNPLFTSTYFQCVITCTNVNQNTTANYVYVLVAPVLTTSTVPCYEGFEGISYTNQLPNCSWLAPNSGSTVNTYTSVPNSSLVACGGNNSRFCTFSLPSSNNAVYTNGIQMFAGITYSAALFYATEFFGYTNWTQLEILVGPNQSSSGLIQVTSVSPAMSGPCKLLSGIFTVPVSGLYYIAVRATATSGNAPYLTWDDLSVTAPCTISGNSPSISVTPSTFSICEGSTVSFTASGADSYTWTSGPIGPVFTGTVGGFGNYIFSVNGTNTLTGCITTHTFPLLIHPLPSVGGLAIPNIACKGDLIQLNAYGGGPYTYTWSTGATTPTTTTTATVTGCYFFYATNVFGCMNGGVACAQVLPLPTITAVYSPTTVCAGEEVELTGSGASSYTWSGASATLNPVKVYPLTATIYTVVGTAINGCKNSTTISVAINECTDVNNFVKRQEEFFILPNPNAGEFIISSLFYNSGFRVHIRDATGRTVLVHETEDAAMKLDLRDLPRGVYYSVIEYSGSVNVIKLVRE